MLDFMRRQAQGWIVKVLFALIVMSFALWGVGDYFSGQSSVTVAKVGGQPITQQALQQRLRDERNRMRRLLGGDFDPDPGQFRGRVLDQMIRERLMELEARRLDLTASDAAVRRAIRSQPVFQQGGSFSTERYRSLISRMGMGPSDFEARTRQDLAVQGLREFLQQGAVVADEEVWKAFRREHERRTVHYFRLSPSAFGDQVDLGEPELKAFYDEHRQDYRRPAQVRVRYVVLSPQALAERFEPEPGELEAFLKDHGDRYAGDDGEVPPLEKVRDRVVGDWRMQQAEDRIYERLPTFKDLLYTREDLAAAAEEFGLTVRTSSWIPEQGDLPEALPQSEAFRKAAFRVAPGRNSEALELGDARFAGLNVAERRAPAVRDFAKVKEQVRRDLRRQKARELARQAAREASQALAGGRPPAEVAEEYGAELETVEGVTRAAMGDKLPRGLGAPVFGAREGGSGTASVGRVDQAVFQVAEVAPPKREELGESQREELAARLRRQRGQARMQALYERLRERYEVRIRREFATGQG